ncbi:Putative rRNA-processing protein Efg1 [Septoria linicola]|uniref:rRNA-processing protein EFG1 n=1 Tax=Septoria linicola TaxID=215465 RepID=A0A9Q9AF52_9PEZI|nr:putative rRNA-processing protein Efg1 [Septoria linicola]USW47960.1 Putative rRNA-processing protein Efg1 [Septoria linicola]
MATKRPAPTDEPSSSSRPFNKRHRTNNAQPHKPLPANLGTKSFKKAHTVNDLKSSIRSLRRLLSGPNSAKLPANVRVEKERALQTAEQDLAREEYAKKKNEVISRWHKVRFFDRQKAERRLKKARKALKDDGESKALQRKVEECETEVNYAMYFPLDQDYVPLFPTRRNKGSEDGATPENEGGELERQGDKDMWDLVTKCAAEGRLKDLREGRLRRATDDEQDEEEEEEDEEQKQAKKKGRNKSDAKQKKSSKDSEAAEKHDGDDQGEADSDNESGGGFFE